MGKKKGLPSRVGGRYIQYNTSRFTYLWLAGMYCTLYLWDDDDGQGWPPLFGKGLKSFVPESMYSISAEQNGS